MTTTGLISPGEIHEGFSAEMLAMYRDKLPAYGTGMELVPQVDAEVLDRDPGLRDALSQSNHLNRILQNRHGAIRVGTAAELSTIRRLFAVMGMQPVGYYNLTEAGVHSTAFRPVAEEALRSNPSRVFTSLLQRDLIDGAALRADAETILARRQIFTPGCLALVQNAEKNGGLDQADADHFLAEALETFGGHSGALVAAGLYQRLHDAHRLIADVAPFKGRHCNHLTPHTLDIDKVQARTPAHGIAPYAVIEGPPTRRRSVLLRQTSFKALRERVIFPGETAAKGFHIVRFAEMEAWGIALTRKGRALHGQLLTYTRRRQVERARIRACAGRRLLRPSPTTGPRSAGRFWDISSGRRPGTERSRATSPRPCWQASCAASRSSTRISCRFPRRASSSPTLATKPSGLCHLPQPAAVQGRSWPDGAG
nr:VOC family protein [Paracoccus rhizosphaerae]